MLWSQAIVRLDEDIEVEVTAVKADTAFRQVREKNISSGNVARVVGLPISIPVGGKADIIRVFHVRISLLKAKENLTIFSANNAIAVKANRRTVNIVNYTEHDIERIYEE